MTMTASDPSGVREIAYRATGAQPIPSTTRAGTTASVTIAAEGRTTLGYRATDTAGNVSPERTMIVGVDKSPPRVTITAPGDGAVYQQGEALDAAFACEDPPAGAGMTVCRGDAIAGQRVETETPGARTFAVTATDAAGHTTTRTVAFTVTRPSPLQPTATPLPTQLAPPDRDRDSVLDDRDNCPADPNRDQADRDGDALGDACDVMLEPGDLPVVVGQVARVRQVSGDVFVKLPKRSGAAARAARRRHACISTRRSPGSCP